MAIEYRIDKDPRPIFIGYEELDHDFRAINEDFYHENFNPDAFPFYNIYKSGNKFIIKMNVAGYKQDSLNVSIHDGVLMVEGSRDVKPDNSEVVFVGLKDPDKFGRCFRIADTITLKEVWLSDGMMTMVLEKNVPDNSGDFNINDSDGDIKKPIVVTPPAPPVVEPTPEPVVVAPEPTPAPVVVPTPIVVAPEPAPVVEEPKPEPVIEPTPALVDPVVVAPIPVEVPVEPAPVVDAGPVIVEPMVEPAPIVDAPVVDANNAVANT